MAARKLHWKLVHKAMQRPDILLKLPDRLVQLRDGYRSEPVLGLGAGSYLVTIGRGRKSPALGYVGIGRGLHIEINRHAAAQELQRNILVARRNGLDDGAVRTPGDSFTLEAREFRGESEVDDDFHGRVGQSPPGIRHLTLQPKPLCTPRLSPRHPVFLGLEFLAQGLHHRNGLVRDIPAAQGQLRGAGVNGGTDTFAHKAVETHFRDPAVVVHLIPL